MSYFVRTEAIPIPIPQKQKIPIAIVSPSDATFHLHYFLHTQGLPRFQNFPLFINKIQPFPTFLHKQNIDEQSMHGSNSISIWRDPTPGKKKRATEKRQSWLPSLTMGQFAKMITRQPHVLRSRSDQQWKAYNLPYRSRVSKLRLATPIEVEFTR